MSKKTLLSFIALVLFTILVFIIFKKYFHHIDTFISSLGLIGPLVSVILYGLLAFTPIPADPLSVMMVAIFHPLITLITIWAGNTVAALMEYYLGHHVGKAMNYQEKWQEMPFGLSKFPIDSVWVLLIGRLISGYGNKFISLFAGAYKVSLKRYLWTTAVTNLLGAILFTVGGHGFKNIVHLILGWLKI